MPELREILQGEASAELEKILSEADSKAEKIMREAEEAASLRLASHQRKMEAAVRAEARRAHSSLELAVSTARMRARGQMIENLRQRVFESFEKIASEADFADMLLALAEEAVKTTIEAEAVVVHPEILERIEPWAKARKLEVRPDPNLRLGVRVEGRNGRAVENTLPERLRRAWDDLIGPVVQILWG